MRMLQALTFAFLAPCAIGFSQAGHSVSLMPLPRQVSVGTGELSVQPEFRVQLQADPNDELVLSAARRSLHSLETRTGMAFQLELVTPASPHAAGSLWIVVHNSSELRIGVDESYSLNISPDGARLEAATSIGALRGLATFRQLIQQDGKRVFLPAVSIEDSPSYPWRGLMIDVARHFVPIDVLERNLDAMELV
jgi:hexosaminidase